MQEDETEPAKVQEVVEVVTTAKIITEVNVGDAAARDVSVAHRVVPTVAEEPSIPSPTPPTLPPQPSQDIPSTSRVENLELDKIAQALEITKLNRRVKKLERRNKVKGRMIAEMDQDVDVVLRDDKEIADEAKEEDETEPAEVQEVVEVVTTAKIITEVVTAANETITTASETVTTAEAQVPAVTLTAAPARVTAALSRGRKGVVIRDLQEESTTSTIIPAETKSKDKGIGILLEEPKPLKKQQKIKQDEKYARELEADLNKNIDWDEAIDHVNKKAKEDNVVKIYQAMKRKPQTEAQARKNMMVYL
nr:hypothetical protein [Tanacetum cinerariifolium]